MQQVFIEESMIEFIVFCSPSFLTRIQSWEPIDGIKSSSSFCSAGTTHEFRGYSIFCSVTEHSTYHGEAPMQQGLYTVLRIRWQCVSAWNLPSFLFLLLSKNLCLMTERPPFARLLRRFNDYTRSENLFCLNFTVITGQQILLQNFE